VSQERTQLDRIVHSSNILLTVTNRISNTHKHNDRFAFRSNADGIYGAKHAHCKHLLLKTTTATTATTAAAAAPGASSSRSDKKHTFERTRGTRKGQRIRYDMKEEDSKVEVGKMRRDLRETGTATASQTDDSSSRLLPDAPAPVVCAPLVSSVLPHHKQRMLQHSTPRLPLSSLPLLAGLEVRFVGPHSRPPKQARGPPRSSHPGVPRSPESEPPRVCPFPPPKT